MINIITAHTLGNSSPSGRFQLNPTKSPDSPQFQGISPEKEGAGGPTLAKALEPSTQEESGLPRWLEIFVGLMRGIPVGTGANRTWW